MEKIEEEKKALMHKFMQKEIDEVEFDSEYRRLTSLLESLKV